MPLRQQDLAQFYGSERLYRHWLGHLQYTEGVKYVADHAGDHGAYWLLDAIASYQGTLRRNPRFREFQFWTLTVRSDQTATLTCEEDAGLPPVVRQELEFTDFDLPEIRFYVCDGVLLLPSEY